MGGLLPRFLYAQAQKSPTLSGGVTQCMVMMMQILCVVFFVHDAQYIIGSDFVKLIWILFGEIIQRVGGINDIGLDYFPFWKTKY